MDNSSLVAKGLLIVPLLSYNATLGKSGQASKVAFWETRPGLPAPSKPGAGPLLGAYFRDRSFPGSIDPEPRVTQLPHSERSGLQVTRSSLKSGMGPRAMIQQ